MAASTNSNTRDTPASIGASESRPPKHDTSDRIGFVPQLESIRGIGALMVAAVHVSQSRTGEKFSLRSDPRTWSDPVWSGLFWLYSTVFNAWGALIIFFVLSGFVLASSISRGPKDIWPSARHFFIGRIFRLYPAIIFAVLLFCVVFWLTGASLRGVPAAMYQPWTIIRNMMLIEWHIDGVMWSLQVEALAIPLIFAVAIGQQRWGLRFTALAAFLLIACTVTRSYRHLVEHGGFLTYYYLFVFGIATHRFGPRLIEWIGQNRFRWTMIAITTVALFFLPRAMLGGTSRWARFSEAIVAVNVIAILVYGGKTTLARVLNWPLWRFYGRISYSFYLLHPLTLIVLWAIPNQLSGLLDAGVPAVFIALGLTVLSVLAITPLAWLSWRFVEIPGIAAGRRLSPDRRNASPYVGARGQLVRDT